MYKFPLNSGSRTKKVLKEPRHLMIRRYYIHIIPLLIRQPYTSSFLTSLDTISSLYKHKFRNLTISCGHGRRGTFQIQNTVVGMDRSWFGLGSYIQHADGTFQCFIGRGVIGIGAGSSWLDWIHDEYYCGRLCLFQDWVCLTKWTSKWCDGIVFDFMRRVNCPACQARQ